MAEELKIDLTLSKEEKYRQLKSQLKSLILPEDNFWSNLANFSAILKQSFETFSWTGFYLYGDNKLYLGPFQGKVACTNIFIGKGVCGTAALNKETIIVDDVNTFPGHIFCDGDSKSEIVVPILKEGVLKGVLDIDSYEYSNFDNTDKLYLEEFINFLSKEIFN